MRKGKDTLIMIAGMTALLSCGYGLAYGFWWQSSQQTRCKVTIQEQVEWLLHNRSRAPRQMFAMEEARNRHTSNFDTVLRF